MDQGLLLCLWATSNRQYSQLWDCIMLVDIYTCMVRKTDCWRWVSTAVANLLGFWRYIKLWPGSVAKMCLASTAYCWTSPSFTVSFIQACLVASAVESEKSLIWNATLSWRYSRRVSVQFGFLTHWISGACWNFWGASASGWPVLDLALVSHDFLWGHGGEWGSRVSHVLFVY